LRIDSSARSDGTVRLAVGGEVDIATVGPLAEAMTAILHDPQLRRLMVDLGEVTFLDSSGISALVSAYRLAVAGEVGFVVVNCRTNVLRTLEITGVDRILTTGTATRPRPMAHPDLQPGDAADAF
jgi:anti-anti-sigma factor